ncbi:transposase [Chloroflexi bacterium TSY]|nr:transposase [Chloroflexi bacterium TSY]
MTPKSEVKREVYLPKVEEREEELSKAETINAFFGREGIFARLFARTIEEMLEAEMNAHLGYEKYEAKGKNSGNSRNGKRSKELQTSGGKQTIHVPRSQVNLPSSHSLSGCTQPGSVEPVRIVVVSRTGFSNKNASSLNFPDKR